MASFTVFAFVVALPVRFYLALEEVFALVASACSVFGVPLSGVFHWPSPGAADKGIASVA